MSSNFMTAEQLISVLQEYDPRTVVSIQDCTGVNSQTVYVTSVDMDGESETRLVILGGEEVPEDEEEYFDPNTEPDY